MYAGAPLSMGAFRRQVPDANRPYRMPGPPCSAPIAFIVANLIIYWSGFEDCSGSSASSMVIGYVLIGICDDVRLGAADAGLEVGGQWLPVYLIGMGIISWPRQRSAVAGARPHFGFLGHGGSSCSFSLVIYYWALASQAALPRRCRNWCRGRPCPRLETATKPPDTGWQHRRAPPRDAGRSPPPFSGRPRPVAQQHPALDQGTRDRRRRRGCPPRRRRGCRTPATSRRRSRRAARLTSSRSGRPGCRATTIWPGRIRDVRPGRIGRRTRRAASLRDAGQAPSTVRRPRPARAASASHPSRTTGSTDGVVSDSGTQ